MVKPFTSASRGTAGHHEIRRLGRDPVELSTDADAIARTLAEALGWTLAENCK
jgi:hypothetical protein